jgi:hypothetical protein
MPRRIYQMKTMIVITKPQVWRRLLVPKTASLFVSPAAAGGVRRKYPDEPYRQAIADGRGTLELCYFETTVLEQVLPPEITERVETTENPDAHRRGRGLSKNDLVETMGLEPTTPCLQSRCSSRLSYVPGGKPETA